MLFSLLLPVHFILPLVYYLTALSSISNYHYPLQPATDQKILPQAAYRPGFQECSVRNCVNISQHNGQRWPVLNGNESDAQKTLSFTGPENGAKKKRESVKDSRFVKNYRRYGRSVSSPHAIHL
jgi:hypothetical protein